MKVQLVLWCDSTLVCIYRALKKYEYLKKTSLWYFKPKFVTVLLFLLYNFSYSPYIHSGIQKFGQPY